MLSLLPRLRAAFPFVGERSATEEDFYRYCSKNEISVVMDIDMSSGVYVSCRGIDFIFLNPKLRGWDLRYVMFHELAHHIFHHPSQSNSGIEFFHIHSKKKNHFEAEAVAALLLLPRSELNSLLQNEEFEKTELADLAAFRLELYRNFKI